MKNLRRIAINGYGRIGRCILRALYESNKRHDLQIVAINEPADHTALAHLTRFDSTHGTFTGSVESTDGGIVVNGDAIQLLAEPDPGRLPWHDLGVDLVLECTGRFVQRAEGMLHVQSGAGKVLFSCPAQPDVDATVVYGLNHALLKAGHTVVSNASCTTNCISHLIAELDTAFGVENGVITTIHSMMNDQPVIDAYHNPDLRKNRSSSHSIIPVSTGLAKGIDRLFPHLQGRFKAMSVRVPTANVSLMQLSVALQKPVSGPEEVNALFAQAASTDALQGILGYSELPLVSCDYNHDPRSAVVDGSQTACSGSHLVTMMAWFDNEWGYANRMLDTAGYMLSL